MTRSAAPPCMNAQPARPARRRSSGRTDIDCHRGDPPSRRRSPPPMSIPDVVIIAGARTPFARINGQPGGPDRGAARHRRDPRRTREGGGLPRRRRRGDHGTGAPGRAGQNPAKQSAVAAGIPWRVPATTGQQGLPVGPRRHHGCRAPDPPRRGIRRRGRRPGVDDHGAAAAPGSRKGWAYGHRARCSTTPRTTA
jgi:acetyl-CoA C-acetyltransferase